MRRVDTRSVASSPDSTPVDRTEALMGTRARVAVGAPGRPGLPSPAQAADAVFALLHDYDARLSRFRADSELVALNADPREVVPAGPLLRDAVGAALWAAERSGGLVDPTILPELERAGYARHWDRTRRLDLTTALVEAGTPLRPAQPRPDAPWRAITVDHAAGTITRPVGMRLDTGGSGKGHAADLAADLLDGYETWAVDCGGDLRLGGTAGLVREVQIENPFTGDMGETVHAREGAVATSGLRSRIWRAADGGVEHHLLDPSTGRPAFTGLVAVTALAGTALAAETLAKMALLGGPDAAAELLPAGGGIAIGQDGRVHRYGRLAPAPRVRLKLPTGAPA